MSNATMNYDPNIRYATQKVRLTFAQWEYRMTVDVEIGGNCNGFDILEGAIDQAVEKLAKDWSDGEYISFMMLDSELNELECDEEEHEFEMFLRRSCIACEIVSIEETKR